MINTLHDSALLGVFARQVMYSIACVVSVVAMYLQGRAFIEQLRFRHEDTSILIEEDETSMKLRKHRKRLVSTQRAMNLVSQRRTHPLPSDDTSL